MEETKQTLNQMVNEIAEMYRSILIQNNNKITVRDLQLEVLTIMDEIHRMKIKMVMKV